MVEKATLYDMDLDPSRKHVAIACQDRNIRSEVKSIRGAWLRAQADVHVWGCVCVQSLQHPDWEDEEVCERLVR